MKILVVQRMSTDSDGYESGYRLLSSSWCRINCHIEVSRQHASRFVHKTVQRACITSFFLEGFGLSPRSNVSDDVDEVMMRQIEFAACDRRQPGSCRWTWVLMMMNDTISPSPSGKKTRPERRTVHIESSRSKPTFNRGFRNTFRGGCG